MWIYFLVCQNYTVGTKKPVVATLYLRCVTYSVLLNNCPSHCRKCPCANFRRGWPYWASANKVWQYELKAMIVKLVIFTYMTTARNQKCLFLCLSLSLPQKNGKPQKWLFVMLSCSAVGHAVDENQSGLFRCPAILSLCHTGDFLHIDKILKFVSPRLYFHSMKV